MPFGRHNPFAQPSRLRRLQIEITTGCNLRCAGCQRTLGMAAGTWHNAHMPAARFAAILANAPQADVVILQGIGEPTLHPDLPRLVAAARASGKFPAISFNTNALVRDIAYYRDLCAAGLNHVSISVDSLDPRTAEAARAGTDCARLADTIRGMIALIGPTVTLSIVLSRLNAPELPALLRRLYDLGGRYIEVQPLVGYAPDTRSLCLAAAELDTARRQIGEAGAALPGLTMLPAAALNPNGDRCRRPLHAAYVTVDGFLTPCCITNDAGLFGRANLAEAPFAALWHSEGVAAWMHAYFDREPSICAGCAFNPAGSPPPALAPPALPPSALPPTLADAERWLREGRLDAAEVGFRARMAEPEALHGLGLVRLQRGDAHGAVALLQAAHSLAPDARSGHNLATALEAAARPQEAIAVAAQVVAAYPDYVPAQLALAGMLEGRDAARAAGLYAALCEKSLLAQRPDLAERCVARLVPLPMAAEQRLRLANLLRGAGQQDLALDLLRPLRDTDPDDVAAGLVAAMSLLAAVHATEQEIAVRRREYARALDALDRRTAAAPAGQLARAIGQVGDAKPFLLAYQGQDDRDLQASYGRIVDRIARAAWPAPSWPAPSPVASSWSAPTPAAPSRDVPPGLAPSSQAPSPAAPAWAVPLPAAPSGPVPSRPAPSWLPSPAGGRLRIGFASCYFHLHSVSKLFGGWIRHLDRAAFEVFGYQFGDAIDPTGTALAACCTAWRRGVAPAARWAEQLVQDHLDVLIYPEIGMHPLPVQLGCLRLAPVQCVAWGHPVTTGLPEIDYFLSSDLMEPDDADAHYTEALIRLPNLSIAYAPLPDRGGTLARDALGLRPDAVVYVCCQSLPKYLPRYDALLARIAAAVPAAQFLFIALQAAPAAILRARLESCFAAAGLDAARHLRFVPPVAAGDFPALLRCGDVYLDSIGWSGGNTTLEALACGLPVVTMPVGPMRGRHSAAILRQMGLDDRIAPDGAAYVAQAVALAEAGARQAFRAAIRDRRHLLYEDLVPVRALERHLRRFAGAGPPAGAARRDLCRVAGEV